MAAVAERKIKRPAPSPMSFRPAMPDDLIGHAREVAKAHVTKARRLRDQGMGSYKLLLYGPPGVGKTTIAELVVVELTGGIRMSVEDYNGKEVTVDVVREWMGSLAYGSLFSDWSVKIVNELDRCASFRRGTAIRRCRSRRHV